MTNNQYITALKKALSALDKQSRNDIIQEIQSHAAESGTPLSERFGSPEELAKQYLDGEIIANPVSTKVLGIGKKLLTWIGLGVLFCIAAIALFIWFISGDDFNYADEKQAQLKSKEAGWVTKDWSGPLNIKLDQSSSVFYWHDESTIRWGCLGENEPKLSAESGMDIRQSKCIVFLPKTALTLKAHQAQIVLVRPQVSVDVDLEQASLRMAENGVKYRYISEGSRMKFNDLQSHDDAELTINISAQESMISQYEED